MTYEEAIKVLTDTRVMILKGSGTDLAKACSMAIEALEKQIPKKPKIIKVPNTSFTKAHLRCECPMCGTLLVIGCRCHNNDCGQAIDWSEWNDR